MSQNRREPEQVVAAARKGSAEAQRQQSEIIKQFAAIDCGTGDEEGNARVVEIIDRQLKLIKGIEITHHYAEGYGIHIVARLKPEKPEGKILLSAHTDTVSTGATQRLIRITRTGIRLTAWGSWTARAESWWRSMR